MASLYRCLKNITLLNTQGLCIANQSLLISEGNIVFAGDTSDLPEIPPKQIVFEEGRGQLLTSGLIDCHTHLVYAGDRAEEFKLRLQGASYADIARQGGGIVSTVKKTRALSEEALFLESLPRIEAMLREGVTTVEIKSGYGLTLDDELKMLKVAKKLGIHTGVRVKTTFLGAHAVPEEFMGRSQEYVDVLCKDMLPAVAASGFADAVDVFCEHIGFTLDQTLQIFTTAKALGLDIKCHAGQLSDMGAVGLAAKWGALSCDHLEYVDDKQIESMASASMVAVLLPGAWYFLGEKQKPPIAKMREAGVGMAIATDCNPGSSPTTSLTLMMNMACQFFGLTVAEALSAVTFQAAKALGLEKLIGSISTGMKADLVLWNVPSGDPLCYSFGYPLARKVMIAGEWKTMNISDR